MRDLSVLGLNLSIRGPIGATVSISGTARPRLTLPPPSTLKRSLGFPLFRASISGGPLRGLIVLPSGGIRTRYEIGMPARLPNNKPGFWPTSLLGSRAPHQDDRGWESGKKSYWPCWRVLEVAQGERVFAPRPKTRHEIVLHFSVLSRVQIPS